MAAIDRHVLRTILLWHALVFASACQSSSQPACPTVADQMEGSLDRFLRWAPSETELIVVSTGPAAVHSAESTEELTWVELMKALPTQVALEVLSRLNSEMRRELQILLAVEACADFQPPSSGLGRFSYADTTMLLVDGNAHRIFQALAPVAKVRLDLVGESVLCFGSELDKDCELFFSCPDSRVMICSNRSDALCEVLTRRSDDISTRCLEPDLLEWSCIDKLAPAWGIRHYRRPPSRHDSTSPLWAPPGHEPRDDDAIGVTFAVEQDGTTTLTYLSASADALFAYRRRWEGAATMFSPRPEINSLAPDRVVIRWQPPPPNDRDAMGDIWFALRAEMGQATSL